jgi:heterodisulfide reductase subunit B
MSGDKKKFTYYPGCSSQSSGSHLDQSLRAIAPELGLELEELDDWNCCGASVGHIEGGQLPNTALSGRNLAKAEQQGKQDIMTGCAACYLNTHGTNEKIKKDVALRGRVNEALSAADLSYDEDLQVRHACEVIVNEVGLDKIKERVTNPLDGVKVAGYVGCQTVRPFANTDAGGKYDTYDDPEFLDNFAEACGAEAVQEDRRRGRGGRRRRDRDALPPLPGQRRDVPGRDKQEVRHRLPHAGRLLQPAHGACLRPRRQEGCGPQPEHDPLGEAGEEGDDRGVSAYRHPIGAGYLEPLSEGGVSVRQGISKTSHLRDTISLSGWRTTIKYSVPS